MDSDERIARILEALHERQIQGEEIDLALLAREHPDLADELSAYMDALDIVDQAFAEDDGKGSGMPERIGGYRTLEELGRGGMGTVYLAVHAEEVPDGPAPEKVALKVIHPHLLERPGFFKRFLREAEIGKRVSHENVVRTVDVDAVRSGGETALFLVMEYVEGQTLADLLRELERVPEELCRHIGREVAKGLQAIHEAGAVHRDLKPENVLVTEDYVVKVMDLGVARLQDEAIRLSQAGTFVGSLEYAAPEQFRAGDGEPDGQADLHALGVLLYELSTGQHPYRDENASKVLRNILDVTPQRAGVVNPQLSPSFEEVLHDLLAKAPEDRFPDAATVAQVLDEGEQSTWWKERAKALRIETRKPLRRIRIPRETALHGRDADLEVMHALFDKVKEGDGQVLLVEGEAGIGKTRLVDEFVGRLRQMGEDIIFLFGSYPPGGAATAAGAFSTAYREHLGGVGLEEALSCYLSATPLLIPAFAALLRGDAPPTGAEPLTKDSLQTVFVHATRGLAAERPTIVLIDDLHFAPEDGRALFSSLAMAVPQRRILLVGTMRPGVPEEWTADLTRLDHAEQRSLSRLGPNDLTKLLTDAFRSERLAEELAFRIAQKSDGNPFFVFEIIRGLREGQFISRQPDGTWVTTQVIKDIQVPSSVMDLIQARLGDLGDVEKDLLDVAACLGFEFDPLLVAAVLGLGRIPALKRLARVEARHRLVRSAGENFLFDHHQVQEALYGALPPPLAREYHAAIAEALAARAGAADEDPKELNGALCVDLCEHYLKGARGEQALRYLDAALEHLEKGFLNDQAIALADRALNVPGLLQGKERLEILLQKNVRLDLLGQRRAQEEVLDAARVLADATADKAFLAKVEQAVGALLLRTSRYEEAKAYFERTLALHREIGDRDGEARVTGNLGIALRHLGRYEEAKAHHERHLAIAREIGDRRSEATALGSLGVVSKCLGRYEEAKAYFERHLAIAREIGDRAGEAAALGNLGVVFHSVARYEGAKAHYERHLALAREIGDRAGEATATGNLGILCAQVGRHEEAKAHHERHLEIAREIGDRRGEARALGSLGSGCAQVGRYEEAKAYLERTLALHREIGDREGEATATGELGNVFNYLGRHEEAKAYLERGLAVAREIGDRRGEATVTGNLGILCAQVGRYEEAKAYFERHLAIALEIGDRAGEARALGSLGTVLQRQGRHEEARERSERCLTLSREIGDRRGEGHALSSLASFADSAGDADEALRLNRQALALLDEMGANDKQAESLAELGRIELERRNHESAVAYLEKALSLARKVAEPETILRATAYGARLPGRDVKAALAALAEHEERTEHAKKMEVRFQLWRVTNDTAHLAEAKRLLDFAVAHVPEEHRTSMLENVPLHRDIAKAWEEYKQKADA